LATRIKIYSIFLLILFCLATPALAQTVFDIGISKDHRVHEFSVGGGYQHRHQPVFAGNGFHYANSCLLVYLVNTFPGSYNLNFSYPAGNINMKPVISLFDRWPYDPIAKRYELPMGPKGIKNRNQIEYSWNMGISRMSTSSLLYIAVELSSGMNCSTYFPHDIYITAPAISPMHTLEKGVTFLQGPADLVLSGGVDVSLSYAVDKAEAGSDASASNLPVMPIKGDIVKNGSFKDGLSYWVTHRDRLQADDVKTFSLSDGILKIKAADENAREGLMQEINTDVKDAASVVLMADVMVKEQTQAGLGPDSKDAPIAIAVGYKDAAGNDNSETLVFYKGFYSLKPEEKDKTIDGQLVIRDQWYRNIFDLMQLEPKPVFIQYISIEGSGWPAREGWIRDIHLIKSGGKE
jgi:hypothetical protein